MFFVADLIGGRSFPAYSLAGNVFILTVFICFNNLIEAGKWESSGFKFRLLNYSLLK
jgi:hypothetical protein